MAQFARPDADITDGAWLNEAGSAVNMFQSIDEDLAAPVDTDYVESESAPASSAVAFGLSNVTDPASSVGHIMRWRRSKEAAGGAQIDMTVQLRQGYVSEASLGTLIKSVADANVPDSATTTTATLSGAEADAITDYTDLQLRVIATQV